MDFDVIVVGGGIVGLSAACAMSRRGARVAVMDAGGLSVDSQGVDARVYAVNRASQTLLQSLGAWEHFPPSRLSPYQRMYVWDASNAAEIDFDARMIGSDKLGTIIEESVIKQGLLHAISNQNVTVFPERRISAVESLPEAISISDGRDHWATKLLMVADGGNSFVRQLLGVSVTTWSYHQQAIVATIRTEKPHQKTAYQVFHNSGPLAFLPLSDPHLCSIVWSISTTKAQALMALGEHHFAQALTHAFATRLGACTVVGQRHTFPLHMRHAKQYSGSHWLLMGDAAHTIHPLAGLGLNVGLADLTAWLDTLSTNQNPLWTHKTLAMYQRQRKHAVWQTIALMEGLKTVFSNPLSPIAAMRGLGLRMCNKITPLKRLFIEHAEGG